MKTLIRNFRSSLIPWGLSAAALIYLCIERAAAQDKLPKDFYEQNFAKSPIESAEKDQSTKLATPSVGTGKPLVKRGEPAVAEVAGAGKPGAQTASAGPSTADSLNGLPIKSIGIIVNSDDREHLFKNLQALVETVRKHKIRAGGVWAIGDGQNVIEFAANPEYGPSLGGYKIAYEIPPKYRVTLSPTWILYTARGEIVLEAISSLDKYIDAGGHFVEGGSDEVVTAAAPVATSAEGFSKIE